MTEVAVNYNINLAQVIDNNTEVDAFQAAEVEAVLTAAGDDKIWNSMDVSDDVHKLAGAGKPITNARVPTPTPVNPTDPEVIEMAKFAVKTYNQMAGTKLVFVKVICGLKWNVMLGTFYALMILTQDDRGFHHDKALTFKAITGHKKLIWYINN